MRGIQDFLRTNARWLGAGALLTFMSSFGQTFFISIFAGEIQASFNLSHGDWSGIYATGTTLSAAIMVWAGSLTDRFRARSLGLVTILCLGFACVAMALNSLVWLLPVVTLALRLAGQGMCSHIAVIAMARWFVATRGKALATASLGFSVGEMMLPIFFVFLLSLVDWRMLWLFSALLCLFSLPVLFRLLRTERVPGTEADEDRRAGIGNRHWTRAEALRHPLFWCVVPAIAGYSAFGTALLFHHVHFAGLKGISHLAFVGLLPIYTGTAICAMIVSGLMLDRFGTRRMMPFYQLPAMLAFLIFGFGTSVVHMALGLACMALTTGSNATLSNAFWAEVYGTAHIGAIKSVAAAAMVLGSALGPWITGVLIDKGVALDLQYAVVSFYFLFTSMLLWFGIRRYASASA